MLLSLRWPGFSPQYRKVLPVGWFRREPTKRIRASTVRPPSAPAAPQASHSPSVHCCLRQSKFAHLPSPARAVRSDFLPTGKAFGEAAGLFPSTSALPSSSCVSGSGDLTGPCFLQESKPFLRLKNGLTITLLPPPPPLAVSASTRSPRAAPWFGSGPRRGAG
jgi:hypothetical protein